MATFDTFRTTSGVARLTSRFSTLIASLQAWNDARITRKALNALTTRELDDLGLSRADIDDIAAGTFRRN